MKTIKKTYTCALVVLILFSIYFFTVKVVFASDEYEMIQTTEFLKSSGLEVSQNATIGSTIATLIEAFLGFLGIIFIIQMIYSGFSWMTASGNEEQVKKATALIRRSIIGLIIIVSAYAITYTVFTLLPGAGGGETTGTGVGTIAE